MPDYDFKLAHNGVDSEESEGAYSRAAVSQGMRNNYSKPQLRSLESGVFGAEKRKGPASF